MNTELFIARRLFSNKKGEKSISGQIVTIAVASISLGVAIMIVAISVLFGFKAEIRDKVIGFDSHLQVVNLDGNNSFETQPIPVDSSLIELYKQEKGITHIQYFATKPGIIKTDENMHGIVLKGVADNFDWDFFQQTLKEGNLPNITVDSTSSDLLISQKIASLLKVKVNDNIFCYFYNEGESSYRSRKFKVSGIYESGLEEFDQLFVIGDIRHVQRISGWSNNEVSGYEIKIDDFEKIDQYLATLQNITLSKASEQSMLKVTSIVEKNSLLFDWLAVLDLNVWVLMVLMIAVAGINMISGLLVIILERTQMIGILKAMGYQNFSIRKVFLHLSALLSIRGLLWGNLIGLGICIIQKTTGIITLDPTSYYLDTVPILLRFVPIALINIGTLISIVMLLVLPSHFISKITPVESIQFE